MVARNENSQKRLKPLFYLILFTGWRFLNVDLCVGDKVLSFPTEGLKSSICSFLVDIFLFFLFLYFYAYVYIRRIEAYVKNYLKQA